MQISKTIAIIGCSKLKLKGSTKAKDLYQGQLFKKARKYCENRQLPYYILSARYGILDPESHIDYYDTTIKDLTKLQLTELVGRVRIALSKLEVSEVVLLAGENYYKVIEEAAPELTITRPMQGLGIGQQLKWLKERTELV